MSNPSHSEIFRNIKIKYGMTTAALVRKYVGSAIRIARHKEHLTFAHRCQRYGVVPSFLRVKLLVRNTLGIKIAERSSRQFLSALIGRCHSAINGIEESMTLLLNQLVNVLSVEEVEDVRAHTARAQSITAIKCKAIQKEKFNKMMEKKRVPLDSRWVVNLSDRELSTNEEAVLKKGLNFAVTPR